jgi:hypothetical protein
MIFDLSAIRAVEAEVVDVDSQMTRLVPPSRSKPHEIEDGIKTA